MRISACYIVKNEEKNLPASMKSLQGAVDEIIVVDTGSTDSTVDIAESNGACVFHFAWNNDFSAPRNFAVEQATGDWIIFLDADESFLYPEHVESGIKDIVSDRSNIDVVMLPMYHQIGEETPDEMQRDWSCRIFRNSPELRYAGKIHENIAKRNGALRLTYADKRLSLLHTGYKAVIIEEKAKRDLALLRREVKEHGEQPNLWLYFVDACYGLKEYDEALRYARMALDSPVQAVTGRTSLYHMAIESLRQMDGSLDEMLKLSDAAVREFSEIPEFYGERGMVLCGMGRFKEARESLLRSAYYYEHPVEGLHFDRYFTRKTAAIIYARLGELFMIDGDMEQAARYFDRALDADAKNSKIMETRNRFLHQALKKLLREAKDGTQGGKTE